MNKKVSLGVTIAVAFIAAAIAFSAAFMLSHSIINSKLSDLNQKQEVFSRLSDIDSFTREHYNGEIDEEKLHSALKEAYSQALDGGVIFLSAQEFEGSKYDSEGYSVMKFSDGSYMIIVNEDTADAETSADSE